MIEQTAAWDIFSINLFLLAVKELVTLYKDPYECAKGAHAIAICTEWDEFTVSGLDPNG